jgi:hypothetical protein
MKVEKTHVREMAMFVDDWTDLGHSIFQGNVAAFLSYLQADLSEEADCCVADAEPHLIQATLSKSDPDNLSWSQAMRSVDSDKWWNAMEIEMNMLENELKAWQLGSKFRRNSGRNSGSGPFSGIFGSGVAGIIF